jgi:hypothetical protein
MPTTYVFYTGLLKMASSLAKIAQKYGLSTYMKVSYNAYSSWVLDFD